MGAQVPPAGGWGGRWAGMGQGAPGGCVEQGWAEQLPAEGPAAGRVGGVAVALWWGCVRGKMRRMRAGGVPRVRVMGGCRA